MPTKKNYVVCLFVLCFAFAIPTFANYLGTTQLGGDFVTTNIAEGPYGSVMVMTPGTGQQDNKSIASGFAYVKVDNLKFYQFPLSVSYTPITGFDLSMALPIIDMTAEKPGFGDLFIGGKYKLNNDFFKCAASLGMVFPTGADRITGVTNNLDILVDLPVEKELDYFILNMNFGIGFIDIDADNSQEIIKVGGAISRSINKKAGASLELMYQDGKNFSSLLAGVGVKYTVNSTNSLTGLIATDLHSTGADILFNLGYSKSF